MGWFRSKKSEYEVITAYLHAIYLETYEQKRRMTAMAVDLTKLNAAIARVSKDVDALVAAHTDPASQDAVDTAAALLDTVSAKAEAAVAPAAA